MSVTCLDWRFERSGSRLSVRSSHPKAAPDILLIASVFDNMMDGGGKNPAVSRDLCVIDTPVLFLNNGPSCF